MEKISSSGDSFMGSTPILRTIKKFIGDACGDNTVMVDCKMENLKRGDLFVMIEPDGKIVCISEAIEDGYVENGIPGIMAEKLA